MDILKKEYKDKKHFIYILNLLIYEKGVEFVYHLVQFNKCNEDIEDAKRATISMLEYSIITNKIFISDLRDDSIYDEKNYTYFLEYLNENYDKFLDIKNTDYVFRYGINYTKAWKKELAKIGLWDRSILNE